MKKKKWLVASMVIVVGVFIFAIAILLSNNNSKKTPIDKIVKGINNNDINSIINSYHPYCIEAMRNRFSNEKLNAYYDSLIENYGKNMKISYKVNNEEKMSIDDIEMYYQNALNNYSNYPYLQENSVEFDTIYTVRTTFFVKGNKGEESGEVEWFVVKINKKYYLLDIQYNTFINQFID